MKQAATFEVKLIERLSGVSFPFALVGEDGTPLKAHAWLLPGSVVLPQSEKQFRPLLALVGIHSDGEGELHFNMIAPGRWQVIAYPASDHSYWISQPLEVRDGMGSVRVVLPGELQPRP